MPRLLVKATPSHGDAVIELERPRTTIGRSARNDLCVEDPFASRLHAEVRRRGDGYWLSDLGSANGTYLNGARLTAPVMLQEKDAVRIGETEIVFTERPGTAPMRGQTSVLVSDSFAQPAPEATIVVSAKDSASNLLSSLDIAQTTATNVVPAVSPQTIISSGASPASGRDALTTQDLLTIISRVSLTLLSPLSLEETLNQVLDCVFEALPSDRGYLMLLEAAPGRPAPELVCKALKTRRPDEQPGEVKLSHSITEQVLRQGASVLTSDAQADPRFQQHQSIVLSGIRSVMAVPLAIEGQVSGMIYVDSSFGVNRFTRTDLELLTLIAGVAAIRIENARLLEVQQAQKRMADELSVASEIQLRLHPSTPPRLQGYDFMGVSFPCYEVGGDYYDFIERRDGQVVIALGDVSGKGMGAALLMSSLHAAVRAQTTTGLKPAEVVQEVNQYIYDNTPSNRYVTFFYSELDPRTHELVYINAGHNSPMLVHASGRVERLDVGGFPVGITPDGEYREGRVRLEPGDVLAIYSDGVTESLDEKEDEFGESRLIEVLQQHRARTAAGIRDRIDEALTRFVGKAKTVDDLTLVILKRE
jgi:phosphoserine phosphatase RsbU/P